MDALTPESGRMVAEILRLQSIPGLGRARAARWVREEGGTRPALARAIREVAAPELSRPQALVAAERLVARCAADGIGIVTAEAPTYPDRFSDLVDPPLLLYIRGRPIEGTERVVAIVGSRRATAYGRRVAEALGRALGSAGVTVVSGLALGIDGEAHAGALAVGGRTAAVLATGLDRAYPRTHEALYRRVVEEGVAYSEHPPGTTAHRHHFPERNRLIAAMAEAVVVVEAAERSGALITARLGLEAGRDVWSVPGQIDRSASVGTNLLLRDGARPVCSIAEVVEAYAPATELPDAEAVPVGVSDLALAVWRSLADGERHLDEIAIDVHPTGAAHALLAAVAELEIGGWIDRSAGARFARRVA